MRYIIGVDPREHLATEVAMRSMAKHATGSVMLEHLRLGELQKKGLYKRPLETKDGLMWDVLSDAPMTTEHANSRFFIPFLGIEDQWVLFTDADVMWKADIKELFELADPKYAVMCVKHNHHKGDLLKKDGMTQTFYERKNWSSVMLWNLKHEAHDRLTLDKLNELPGRNLHAFYWLRDEEIGELPNTWNHLVNVDGHHYHPKLVHYTLGCPCLPGHDKDPFSEEWFEYLTNNAPVDKSIIS